MIIYLIIHLLTGLLTYAITLAHISDWHPVGPAFPSNRLFSVIVGLFGPAGLILAIIIAQPTRTGLRFW